MQETLAKVKNLQKEFYSKVKLSFEMLEPEHESQEYAAHLGFLGQKKFMFRIAKKTPTKVGWFVTCWKRNHSGQTTPYTTDDNLDFFLITIVDGEYAGQFVFPKNTLIEKNILSHHDQEGKRGFRFYTLDDIAAHPQAIKTQPWQKEYFIRLSNPSSADSEKILNIYHQ